jgi:hypothetical protein
MIFIVGPASVVFDSAYVAVFPALVPPEQIADGNAKMTMRRARKQQVRDSAVSR